MCTLHVVIFCQDNIEWYNSCSKENINRHNFFYDCAYRTVHSKCSVWNAVTFDILNQISCLRCHSAAFVLLFLMIIKSQHNTRFQKNLEVPTLEGGLYKLPLPAVINTILAACKRLTFTLWLKIKRTYLYSTVYTPHPYT